MVLNVSSLASSIPSIFGGFAPFPNTIGTALMNYQSEAIGYSFGLKFQYAKRAIGALSNEDFNALTLDQLGNMIEAHNSELISRMKSEMPKWLDVQQNFIEASVDIEMAKANRTPSAWAEVTNAFIQGLAGADLKIEEGVYDGTNEGLVALTSVSPVLGMLAVLGQLGTGSITPPDGTGVYIGGGEVRALTIPEYQIQVVGEGYTAVEVGTDLRNFNYTCQQLYDNIQLHNQRWQEIDDLGTASQSNLQQENVQLWIERTNAFNWATVQQQWLDERLSLGTCRIE